MSLTQELLTFGLSNKEADVYLSAMQLGLSSVQEIAEKAGLNRTTTYGYIKGLISRGLMSVVESRGRLSYTATKPEQLKTLTEQQEQQLRRRREALDGLLPQLESIYNLAKDKPSVQFFDHHPDNLKKLRDEIVNLRSDEVYNLYNYEKFHEYTNRKHIQGILDSVQSFKAIYIAKSKILDPRIRAFQEHEKFKLKFLPEDRFGFLCEVLITDDRVYIARDKDSLIIKDRLFTQTLALLFNALWGLAERFE